MVTFVMNIHLPHGCVPDISYHALSATIYFDTSHTLRPLPENEILHSHICENIMLKFATLKDTVEMCDAIARSIIADTECIAVTVHCIDLKNDEVSVEYDLTPIYLSFGSNIGDRLTHIHEAVQKCTCSHEIYLDKTSSVIDTMPIGVTSQPNFFNMVIKARTFLTPEQLLIRLKKIEQDMGRVWTKKNYPRIIDIDILYYGSHRIQTPHLTIPHPQVYDRPFVSALLAEINPSCTDPVTLQMHPFFETHAWPVVERRI